MGGDHPARRRHQAAAQPAVGIVRIAVGGDDCLAGLNPPACGVDLKGAPIAANAVHRRFAMDGDAGLDRSLHKTGKIRAHHAAVVEVAADFPVLFRLTDHLGVNIEMFVETVRLAALGFVVRRAHCAGEASDRLVIAVDVFGEAKAARPSRAALASP